MRNVLLAILLLLLLPAVVYAEGEESWSPSPVPVDVGLDPGHSRVDVGAVGGGLRENDVTLDLANRVRALLQEHGVTVALSHEDDNPLTDFSAPDPTDAVRMEQEARIAAVGSAKIYVSIHLNGYGYPQVRGAEFYYNGDNNGEESHALAEAIHTRLLSDVRAAGYPLTDRGAKEDLAAGKPYGHFFSLRGEMPSVLVEAMFLTNPTEAAWLSENAARDAIAGGITGGILDYLRPNPGDE